MVKVRQVGAGGYWRVFNEKSDSSVVRQSHSLVCVAAVGEMLLQARGEQVSQTEIARIIGTPSNAERLAKYLNGLGLSASGWIGGCFDVQYLDAILATGTWGAVLREGSPLGHMVLVEGVDDKGRIRIKDPFDQTAYQMARSDFIRHLSEFVCEKR